MTKLVVTMDEKQLPVVERYEGDIKVRERKITHEKLFRTVLEQSSMELIFDILVNRRPNDVEMYLNAKDNGDLSEESYKFILNMFYHIQDGIVSEDMYTEFAELVIEKVESEAIPLEKFTKILAIWVKRLGKTPSKMEYLDLYKDILHYFLGSTEGDDLLIQKELLKTIYKYMSGLKEKQKINQWVENHLSHMPVSSLLKAVQEQTESNSNVILGFASVPKNAAFVVNSNHGTIYLYEIPKTKLRVKYHDVAFEEVGHPRLLFAIFTDNTGQVRKLKLCAIKGKKQIALDTPVFHYPYSNVYDNGSVCWGGYFDLPIDQIPSMFLSTPNNNHLNENTLELFKKYEGKAFNDRSLKPYNVELEKWLSLH